MRDKFIFLEVCCEDDVLWLGGMPSFHMFVWMSILNVTSAMIEDNKVQIGKYMLSQK